MSPEITHHTSPLFSLSNPALIGAAWMVSSSLFTTFTTTRYLKYPMTDGVSNTRDRSRRQAPLPKTLPPSNQLTMMRFLGSLILGLTLHPNLRILQRLHGTLAAVPDFFLPAIFLFVANLSNSFALDRIGISLTYTSKCAIPLITVVLTLILDGSQALPNALALVSLVPIALGIAGASWNTPQFDGIGFGAALLSATAQSALNVTSKRVLSRTGATGILAQRTMVAIGWAITLVVNSVWLYNSGAPPRQRKTLTTPRRHPQQHPPWPLTVAAVVAYHIEYVLSFLFVSLVAPVTYGACDAVRRLLIIVTGRFLFPNDQQRWTRLNVVGILLALGGALGYSIVK